MNDSFIGYVALESTIKACLLTDASGVPTDATGNPSYRIYGEDGIMTNGTGSLTTFRDTGAITGATNATPIVITSAGHGLVTGQRVTITGVGGNTAANTTAVITVVDSNTFSLNAVAGNGVYTSGGVWHQSGLYIVSLTPAAADGYAAGMHYTVLLTYVVSGTTKSTLMTFGVV